MAHDPNAPRQPYREPGRETGGRTGTGIAFVVGGLVVLVALIAYFMFARPTGPQFDSVQQAAPPPAAVDRAPLGTSAPTIGGVEPGAPVPGTDGVGNVVPGADQPATTVPAPAGN